MGGDRCLACGSTDVHVFLDLGSPPVFCNVLWDSENEARSAPRGHLALASCGRCGVIANPRFDPRLATYTDAYENSLHYSPTFQRFAEDLCQRLIDRFHLDDSEIVEVGAGTGDFLALLCRRSGSRGTGFDPSSSETRDAAVRVLAGHLPTDTTLHADLVVCRHVLEHVPDPVSFLTSIRTQVPAPLYVEVPDATYMLEEGAVFDVIYEHCGYYTDEALTRVLERGGYRVTSTGRSYGEQFLWAEAVPADEVTSSGSRAPVGHPSDTTEFGELLSRTVERWTDRVSKNPGSVAVWGAGSKGTAFVNALPSPRDLWGVVDISPRKRGRYIPGTGHQVLSPEELRSDPPDLVLVMNPMYVDEIRRTLAELDLQVGTETL